MKRFFLYLSFACISGLGSTPSAKTVIYDCTRSDGDRLLVTREKNLNYFYLYNKQGLPKQRILIQEHLSFFDEGKEPIDYLFSLPSIEVRSQFERRLPQIYHVSFFLEGRIIKDLNCKPYELGIPIKVLSNPQEFIRADQLWLTRAARGVRSAQTLSIESVEMWKSVIRRFSLLQPETPKKEWEELIKKTFRKIQVLSPGAVEQISSSLGEQDRETWGAVLNLFQYPKLSPLDRWVWWIELSSQGNLDALRSAIREATHSQLLKESALEQYFFKSAQPYLKKITAHQKKQILSTGLNEKEKKYFDKIWKRSQK